MFFDGQCFKGDGQDRQRDYSIINKNSSMHKAVLTILAIREVGLCSGSFA